MDCKRRDIAEFPSWLILEINYLVFNYTRPLCLQVLIFTSPLVMIDNYVTGDVRTVSSVDQLQSLVLDSRKWWSELRNKSWSSIFQRVGALLHIPPWHPPIRWKHGAIWLRSTFTGGGCREMLFYLALFSMRLFLDLWTKRKAIHVLGASKLISRQKVIHNGK